MGPVICFELLEYGRGDAYYPVIRLHTVVTPVLLVDWTLSIALCLILIGEASCHVGPHGKEPWWPLTNSQLGTETLSSTDLKELNSANKHTSLEADPSPVKPAGETQPWQTPCLQLGRDSGVDDPAKLCLPKTVS